MRPGSNLAPVCQRSLGKKNLFGLKEINSSVPKKPIKCNSHFWDLLWFPRENGSQGRRVEDDQADSAVMSGCPMLATTQLPYSKEKL